MTDLLFVDTSIQVSKVLGSKEQKARILARLGRADNIITSSYVLMEFNRRVISDCIWLHKLMKETPVLANLLRRIVQEGFGRLECCQRQQKLLATWRCHHNFGNS